jgi:hypothetical protein
MSTRTPRSILVLLLTLAAALACLATPSLATALEAPETLKPELETITASSATLRGFLSPHSLGELGATYEFLYNASETGECKGGASTTPGMVLGGEAEPVFEPVEGLSQQTVYAVCLVEHNQAKTEAAVGPAVTFLTGPPETPEGEEATNITATGATLKATLNPHHNGEPGRYTFVYRQSEGECKGYGGQETPEERSVGGRAEVVQATVANLLPSTTYTFCAWAYTEASQVAYGAPVTFTTSTAAPTITSEAVTHVTAEEATITAEISSGGLAGNYSLEYEPGGATPEASLPASSAPVRVSQRISGLQPGSQYHYRFVAHNALGTSQGTREAFATPPLAVAAGGAASCPNATLQGYSSVLPDCRAYELVSGAGEAGEVYVPGGFVPRKQDVTTARPFRAAADGDSVAYLADPGPVGGTGSSAYGRGEEYMARRGPSAGTAGWETVNITPSESPGENYALAQGLAYVAFSPDLSAGILSSQQPLLGIGATPQAPSQCEATLYARGGGLASGVYGALFGETLSPGFCGTFAGAPGKDSKVIFAGETPDHAVRLFDSTAALVSPAVASTGYGSDVYASSANGALALVNILPNGSVEPHAVAGGPSEMLGNGPDLSGVISPDGSRIIWSSVTREEPIGGQPAAFPKGLYVRENPFSGAARTVQLDAAVEGAPGPSGEGEFWASAANGEKVFFTDCHKLTPDSTADEAGGCAHESPRSGLNLLKTGSDLFEYEFGSGGSKLTDLTVDHDPSDALGADVQGVIGSSEDGDFVYFVAGGSFGAAPNERGVSPQPGTCTREMEEELEGHVTAAYGCNLFELHFNGMAWERPKFIARLASEDGEWKLSENRPTVSQYNETVGDWSPELGTKTAEVTPSGEALVFSSTQDLTGYDVASARRAIMQDGGNEIFLFNAATDSLKCVSCSPQAAALDLPVLGAADVTHVPTSSSGTFMRRWVNASGTEVFFDSGQSLVPGDNNGLQDVYEWEAEGTPGCPRATSVFGGCVFLLSGGESSDYSFLVDADESGENVFIAHRGPLGAGPRDNKFHLYDVRVGGGFAVSERGCTGTGCQGVPPAAPIFVTPASVTFAGVGNFAAGETTAPRKATRSQKLRNALRVCRRYRSKGRKRVCERHARRYYPFNSSQASLHRSNERERTAR